MWYKQQLKRYNAAGGCIAGFTTVKYYYQQQLSSRINAKYTVDIQWLNVIK